ncbi:hypothetical protein BD779DRAFT_1666260 [Infundibulicybe gibba]|nr:hypothetical protein BD779DRAFT_1666260 [Infundibulicybe gibba]
MADMHISFTPPLGDTLRLEAPGYRSPHTPIVHLRFKAVFSPQDYDRLKHDGGTVQLWSNVPWCGDNQTTSEWGPRDFVEIPPSDGVVDAASHTFPLNSTSPQRDVPSDAHILHLLLPVPRSCSLYYSFTYRVLYPSGKITWLGKFGRDGTISLDLADPAIRLEEQWAIVDGLDTWCSGGREVHDEEVATVRLAAFRVVGFPNQSAVMRSERLGKALREQCATLFLIPSKDSGTVVQEIHVLSASEGLSLTIWENGTITAAGMGSITLLAHDRFRADFAELAKKIYKWYPHAQWVENGTQQAILDLKPTPGLPSAGYIIPFPSASQTTTGYNATIDIAELLASQPGSTDFVIYSDIHHAPHFISLLRSNMLTFTMDSIGGPFILSPLYHIQNAIISVITPHLSTSLTMPADGLPTPPPSPRFKTVANPATPHALGDTSETPVAEATATADTSANAGPTVRLSSSASRLLASRMRPPGLVRGIVRALRNVVWICIRHTFALSAFFVLMLLRFCFGLREEARPRVLPPNAEQEVAPSVHGSESEAGEDPGEPNPLEDTPAPVPCDVLWVEARSGKLSLLVRSADPTQLVVEQDGERLQYSTKQLDSESAILFESDIVKQGWVKISL